MILYLFLLHYSAGFVVELGLKQLLLFGFVFPQLGVDLIVLLVPVLLGLQLQFASVRFVARINFLIGHIPMHVIAPNIKVFLILFHFI